MEFVSYTEKEGVSEIVMNDGKANAMGFKMFAELEVALERALASSNVIILTGRPGLLSAGFDLKVIQEGTEQEKSKLVSKGISILMRLFGLANPLVVASSGHAVALGGFLMLVGDYRIGVKGDYKIGLNETAIGLSLPMFGLELVKNRLNSRYVTRSAINAELFSPNQAVEAGFLDAVVAEESLLEEANLVAKKLNALDRTAFKNTKMSLRQGLIEKVLAHHDVRAPA
tara:strand:+ start:375 stop:1058 length:684 start_codon:yes stop_codon:yes gene_type:complete